MKPIHQLIQATVSEFTKGTWRVLSHRIRKEHDIDWSVTNDHGVIIANHIDNRADARLIAQAKQMFKLIERYAYIDKDAARIVQEVKTDWVMYRNADQNQTDKKRTARFYEPAD